MALEWKEIYPNMWRNFQPHGYWTLGTPEKETWISWQPNDVFSSPGRLESGWAFHSISEAMLAVERLEQQPVSESVEKQLADAGFVPYIEHMMRWKKGNRDISFSVWDEGFAARIECSHSHGMGHLHAPLPSVSQAHRNLENMPPHIRQPRELSVRILLEIMRFRLSRPTLPGHRRPMEMAELPVWLSSNP